MTRPGAVGLLLLLFSLVSVLPCHAQHQTAEVPHPVPFDNEALFGPTNVQGMVGNGKVTAGISAQGEITVLRWPNPSLYEHLAYRTRPGKNSRQKAHFGARANHGVFLAWVENSSETATGQRVYWLRDARFQHDLHYAGERSAVLVDAVQDRQSGHRFEVRYFVPPGSDLLTLEVYSPAPWPEGVELMFYENLAPTGSRLQNKWLTPEALQAKHPKELMQTPLTGQHRVHAYNPLWSVWLDDADYLEYSSSHQALIHARAQRIRDENTLNVEVSQNGPYIAIGGDSQVLDYHCGDAFGLNQHYFSANQRGELPPDAYRDAQDGLLSKSDEHRGHSNAALRLRLNQGSTSIYLSFAEQRELALQQLQQARQTGAAHLRQQTEDYWHKRMAKARLPQGINAAERKLFLRTLIAVLQAQDPQSGAIVASIATQPPYAQDWPRDGAFFNLALDWAGFHDEVTLHQRFYARVQRQHDRFLFWPRLAQPRGSFEMNYFANGQPGGPIVHEIDNTALLAWSFWEHYRYLKAQRSKAEAQTYLKEIYPTLRLAAEGLAAWRDPDTKLHKPAYEDDRPYLTQGIQGAGTIHLALRSAIQAGKLLGEDPDVLASWQQRVDELWQAILQYHYDAEEGFDKSQRHGAVSLLLWPVELLPRDDDRWAPEEAYLWETLESRMSGRAGAGAYDTKALMALLWLRGQDPQWRPRLDWAYRTLVNKRPIPGTLHMGETYVTHGQGEAMRIENRTSIPHIWAASLVYLSGVYFHEGQIEP